MQATPAKRRKGVYKFVIREDISFPDTAIRCEFENEWLKIDSDGTITVKGSNANGYAWDGCTPKFNLFDIALIGTPDGRINVNTGKPVTYYASLVHDVLCQFWQQIGIERKEADRLFLHYLGDFQLRYIYYAAVRIFGAIITLLKRPQ